MKRRLYIFNGILCLSLVIADQVTKYIVSKSISFAARVEVIPYLLELTVVHNRGAAFGIGNNWPPDLRIAVFYVLNFVAVCVIGWLLYKTDPFKERLAFTSLSLILSGAIGNVIDRIRLGYVVDFVYMHWGTHYWPAYNVADAAISIGAVLLAIQLLWPGKQTDG